MTTKKQRRQRVAEKRAKYDEETRRMGLLAIMQSRQAREERQRAAQEQHDLMHESVGSNNAT